MLPARFSWSSGGAAGRMSVLWSSRCHVEQHLPNRPHTSSLRNKEGSKCSQQMRFLLQVTTQGTFLSTSWGNQGGFQHIASGLVWADIKKMSKITGFTFLNRKGSSVSFFFFFFLNLFIQWCSVHNCFVLCSFAIFFSDRQEKAQNFVFHSYCKVFFFLYFAPQNTFVCK